MKISPVFVPSETFFVTNCLLLFEFRGSVGFYCNIFLYFALLLPANVSALGFLSHAPLNPKGFVCAPKATPLSRLS